MHSFLLLPGKLESKIIPLKHLSQECISSSTLTDAELMRKSCTLMRYNVARKPFPFTPKKQLLHNWERKHHVLREDLHSGKEKISTAIAHYMVMFAMSPWRMYSPDMNCSTVSETNGLFYISWEGEPGVVGALCIIAGFHKELSCGIPSKTTSCYDQQETKRFVPFLCHIPVDYLSLSSSTENCICRCLLYNHEKLFQA